VVFLYFCVGVCVVRSDNATRCCPVGFVAKAVQWHGSAPRSRGGPVEKEDAKTRSPYGYLPIAKRVCVLLLQDLLQSCSRGGRRRVEDMCYERRRAEACVDVGPVRNPVL
jgi:hypothetical protein